MPSLLTSLGTSRRLAVRVAAALVGSAAVLAVLAPGAGATTRSTHDTSPLAQVAASARADDDPANPQGRAPAGASTPAVAAPATLGANAVAVPPTPSGLPSSIESFPVPYEPQTSCDPTAKPGVTAWMNVLTTTYGARNDGIGRTCYIGSTSEHEEGRALDWGIDARDPTQYGQGMAVVSWLLAKDSAGHPAAMARRLGIMYVIFNSKILGMWNSTPTWEPYSCSGVTACHIDHMHFSFTWDGALGKTSYWTKTAVTSTDYGPCRISGLAWAPQRTAANYSSCSSVSGPPTASNPPSWYASAAQWSGVTLRSGSSDAAVTALQGALGVPASGTMDGTTVSAVQRFQTARGLGASGVVDASTWRALLASGARHRLALGDFTGAHHSDVAVFRPGTGTWNFRGAASVSYGASTDIPVVGDFTGDGYDGIAIFRPSTGTWSFRNHADVVWGQAGDIPVPADYNGDGITDIAVFRPSTGTWWIRGQAPVSYGQAGDIPLPYDFTGAGKAQIALFRPGNGTWNFRGMASVQYGQAGDIPVPEDFTGAGKAQIALFRPGNGTWNFRGMATVQYGQAGDIPLPGDFTGAGKAQIALFRPGNGTWNFRGMASVQYGQAGDIPLVYANPMMAMG